MLIRYALFKGFNFTVLSSISFAVLQLNYNVKFKRYSMRFLRNVMRFPYVCSSMRKNKNLICFVMLYFKN